MTSTTRPSQVNGDNGRSLPLFTWNRAHWIGTITLAVLMLVLGLGTGAFMPLTGGPDDKFAAPTDFIWLYSMVTFWPIGLAAANLALGATHSGSLSFPLVSTMIGPLGFGWCNIRFTPWHVYRDWGEWLNLMRSNGLPLIGNTLVACALQVLLYGAIAFACYAIGRYGLRRLFLAPQPGSVSSRMVAWVQRDTLRFGCWLTMTIMYGLMLILNLLRGEFIMALALMFNFVVPPVMLVTCGLYALRPAALGEQSLDADTTTMSIGLALRSALFPLVSALIGVVQTFAAIGLYLDECPSNGICTQVSSWFIDWSSLVDEVRWFGVVFLVAGYLGYLAVLLPRLLIRAVRNRRR